MAVYIRTLEQLFQHELGKLLGSEQSFAQLMQEMHRDSLNPELCELLHKSLEGAAEQKNNLEAMLGKQLSYGVVTDEGAEGMVQEYQMMAARITQTTVGDLYRVGMLGRMTNYKINSYAHLIKMGRALERFESVVLLRRNLDCEIMVGQLLINLGVSLSHQATFPEGLQNASNMASRSTNPADSMAKSANPELAISQGNHPKV